MERGAVRFAENQAALADKHSSARLFAGYHLETDSRLHRSNKKRANRYDISGLDR
jgi:hypothetical protein